MKVLKTEYYSEEITQKATKQKTVSKIWNIKMDEQIDSRLLEEALNRMKMMDQELEAEDAADSAVITLEETTKQKSKFFFFFFHYIFHFYYSLGRMHHPLSLLTYCPNKKTDKIKKNTPHFF